MSHFRPRLAFLSQCVLLIGCWLTGSSTASAIDIDVDFQPGDSTNPSYDPNASGLISLFNFAAAYYGDIFEDTHNITINFWYEELSGNTLGRAEWFGNNPLSAVDIRIDPSYSWFIDPTPDDNDEFAMDQELWSEITAADRTDFFNFGANIPSTFEVGFFGAADDSGPADSRYDMLSVILHEMGHALGVNESANETADGDYDFDPDFVFGRSLAAEVADGDTGHLADDYALMYPNTFDGVRTLPSHTDLFSMASANGYTELDVPRREFYGVSDWNDDSNWSGNREPEFSDDVFVRNALTVNLSADGFSRELHVLDNADLNLGSHNFVANGRITVDSGGRIIFAGGILHAVTDGRLRIGSSGEGRFEQRAGYVSLDNNLTLGVNAGSRGVYQLDTGTLSVSNNSPIEVGRGGRGQLVQNGGTIDAELMYVGRFAGSDGLFRNLGGHTRIQGAIDIGREGLGTMRIHGGSLVSNNNGTIGVESGSTGSVTVTGAEARWTNSGFLKVGEYGIGALVISDRGSVSSASGFIGDRGGSNGTATVTGSLSTWDIDGNLSVGVNGTGALMIENGGTVTSASGFVGSGADGHGTVTVSGFNTKWIGESLYVGGSTQPGGSGTFTVDDSGRVIVDSLKIWDAGTVNLNSGQLTAPYMDIEEGSFNMTGGRLTPRELIGSLENVGGRLAPFGDSTGGATLNDGNYIEQPGATLEIGIDGSGLGQYDSLSISGSASLAGELEIGLIAGFIPTTSDIFPILSSLGTLSGSFGNVINGQRLSTLDGLGSFLVNYGPSSTFHAKNVVLSNFAQNPTGDFDFDGDVDGRDFLAWQRNPSIGDLADWQANFGAAGSLVAANVAVPEPGALVLMTFLGAAVLVRRGDTLRT